MKCKAVVCLVVVLLIAQVSVGYDEQCDFNGDGCVNQADLLYFKQHWQTHNYSPTPTATATDTPEATVTPTPTATDTAHSVTATPTPTASLAATQTNSPSPTIPTQFDLASYWPLGNGSYWNYEVTDYVYNWYARTEIDGTYPVNSVTAVRYAWREGSSLDEVDEYHLFRQSSSQEFHGYYMMANADLPQGLYRATTAVAVPRYVDLTTDVDHSTTADTPMGSLPYRRRVQFVDYTASITVPAGTFQHCLTMYVREWFNGELVLDTYMILAPGVGLIRQDRSSIDDGTIVGHHYLQLTSYLVK